MVEKPVLKNKGRVTGQREIRPVWNKAQRVNHQNKLTHPHPKRKFVPTSVLTKSGQVSVNVVKQSSPRATTLISTARPVNIAGPKSKVNDALPTTYSYFKVHLPVKRAFNQKSAAKTNNLNEKVKTARVNNVTTAGSKAVLKKDGRTCNIKQKCVKSQTPRQAKRGRDTKIPQFGGLPEKVGDEAVHKELDNRMETDATTASSLEAEQDSGNINRTQSIATLNEPSP
ncbi:hypothetical protein Tco_1263711 [Tanacetum coccineum]